MDLQADPIHLAPSVVESYRRQINPCASPETILADVRGARPVRVKERRRWKSPERFDGRDIHVVVTPAGAVCRIVENRMGPGWCVTDVVSQRLLEDKSRTQHGGLSARQRRLRMR
jgi:hypothetical protein